MLTRILAIMVIAWVSQAIVQLVLSSEESDLEYFRRKCSTKLDFKTIHEFQEFVSKFFVLEAAQAESLLEPLKTCLSHRQALIELKELVDNYDKERPCKHSEVAKLDDYARKHFMLKGKARPWSLKFFTLFGVNIGLRCKLNLLAHLRQAESEVDQLDFIYGMASPTGWNVLINEHTKKTMKFGTSSNEGNSVINRVAKLVPGLTQVGQLDFMLFDHPLNKNDEIIKNTISGIERDTHELEGSLEPIAQQQVHGYLEKIVESCQRLDQFYYNSILSLARLNELGLLVNMRLLDEMQESSLMLHRWLAAASFCQVMVRVRVGLRATPLLDLELIHEDSLLESRRTLYSYVAAFDEISDEARANVWLASLSDGKWLRKDEAMFKGDSGGRSVAMLRLRQFIKGLERDYITWRERNK